MLFTEEEFIVLEACHYDDSQVVRKEVCRPKAELTAAY
jgi:hypothetical protein